MAGVVEEVPAMAPPDLATTEAVVELGPAPASTLPASGRGAVIAKYYAWFDEKTWTSGTASDLPEVPYRSADRRAIERQVAQAQAAGIDGFALNWWGADNPTDENLRTLLDVAARRNFTVTVDVDLNSPFWGNEDDVANALAYLSRYLGHAAWYRLDASPVVSFYGIRKYSVGTWGQIRAVADPNRAATWIGEGDLFAYLSVFDGIHPYSVAWSPNPAAQLASYAARTRAYAGKLWVATVMPGYDDTRLGRGAAGFAVNRADGAYYERLWKGAAATNPAFVMITSWNEWPEGSQIEPSRSYGDLYLQLTRQLADSYRASVAGA
jgi:hypothetical protein